MTQVSCSDTVWLIPLIDLPSVDGLFIPLKTNPHLNWPISFSHPYKWYICLSLVIISYLTNLKICVESLYASGGTKKKSSFSINLNERQSHYVLSTDCYTNREDKCACTWDKQHLQLRWGWSCFINTPYKQCPGFETLFVRAFLPTSYCMQSLLQSLNWRFYINSTLCLKISIFLI